MSNARKRPAPKPKSTPKLTPVDPVPVFDEEPGEDRPAYYVVDDTFYAVTSDGMLAVPMRFKTGLFKKVMASDGDNVELFLMLIDGIGDEATIAQLDELDIFESARIAGTYFQAWREKQDATLGEAQRSSN
jgi:hypothetical protein